MSEEQTQLRALLEGAISRVYSERRFLMDFEHGKIRGGLEQAFVFRTGIHLNKLLQETPFEHLDLDSEYNKNHGNLKTSRRFRNGIRPDLIIHRRDSNEENKLIVEFKGWWSRDIDKDILKLEDLTNPYDNYMYQLGVLVIIGKNNADFRYFINGSEYE